MKNIIEKCRTTRILATIGIAAMVLGIFLPYAKFSLWGYSYSISLWGYLEGKIVMLLAIANLLFIFKDIVEKYAPFMFNSGMGRKIQELDNPKFSLIPTVLSAIFIIVETTKMGVSSFKYYNLGFYSLWLGVICLVAYAILHRNEDNA